jgi:hypothetical protein
MLLSRYAHIGIITLLRFSDHQEIHKVSHSLQMQQVVALHIFILVPLTPSILPRIHTLHHVLLLSHQLGKHRIKFLHVPTTHRLLL